MKENNVLQEKTYAFSIRILKLSRYLREKKEYALANQILRSGTSIGANVEEAIGGASLRDFKGKLEIAYKEARETLYWLRLLKDTGILNQRQATSIIADCEEILRILGSIATTIKKNIQENSDTNESIRNS